MVGISLSQPVKEPITVTEQGSTTYGHAGG